MIIIFNVDVRTLRQKMLVYHVHRLQWYNNKGIIARPDFTQLHAAI